MLRNGNRQYGYSLLEVLVAFALLAAALSVLLGALSTAARQVGRAEDEGRARLHAQSLLAGLGIESPLVSGQRSGDWDDGRYQWTLTVTPWQDPAGVPATGLPDAGGPALLQLQLQVRWGEHPAEQLQVDSLRLVHPPLAGALP